MPIATGEETNEQIAGKKYAVYEGRIAYANTGEIYHSQVARNNFPDIPEDDEARPLVEDAGEILIQEGKIIFGGIASTTCMVLGKGKGYQGRNITNEIAKGLFGKDRIW